MLALLALVAVVLLVVLTSRPAPMTRLLARLGLKDLSCSAWEPQRHDLRAATSAAPAEGLSWSNDEEFWAQFPCNRSEYRILLAKRAPPASECDATVVTAWFDLGRSSWATFTRSTQSYLDNMRVVMSLRNPMVVFTTPDFAEAILDMRREAGMLDRTTLVAASSLACTPVAHLHKPVRLAMCSPKLAYNELTDQPDTPERMQPWYNLLMYAKMYLFKAASLLPQTASGYFIWLDAGCHVPMCGPFMKGVCFQPKPHARHDRLRIAQVAVMSPAEWVMDPVTYYRRSLVHFAGTMWGTGAGSVGTMFDAFTDAMRLMITLGAVDQDQAVWAAVHRKQPELLDPYLLNQWQGVGENF